MSVSSEDIERTLRSVALLAHLSAVLVAELSACSDELEIAAGSQLFSEGDSGDAVYVVVRGAIQITVSSGQRDALVLARLGPGELFGEHYLSPNRGMRRSASARAQEQTQLLRIPGFSFEKILLRDQRLAQAIEARRAEINAENLSRRSATFRQLQLTGVIDPSRHVSFPPGAVVFREGDPADAVYWIISGRVEIYAEQAPSSVLAELDAGQCFGERACINDSPRSASVRAATSVQALVISRERFVQLHQQSPALRNIVEGLELTYRLPQRGTALLYFGNQGGEESIERLYRLDDGRRFLSSYVPALGVFRLESVSDGERVRFQEYAWAEQIPGEADKKRLLRIAATGEIVGIQAAGSWLELPQIIESAIDARPLPRDAIAHFEKNGQLKDAVPVIAASGFACFCMQVEISRILELAAAGHSTFESLRRELGCGSVCGGCEPQIRALLGQSEWIPIQAIATPQTSEVRVFRLVPLSPSRLDWKTGQHVVISGRMAEHWVNRCYTITTSPGAGQAIEIAVKREPHGLFSRWIFEGDSVEKQLRIAPPRGEVVWQPRDIPTVCLVAGIGVTPALAILRSLRATAPSNSLHIDYSGAAREQMAFAAELEAAVYANVSITIRETNHGGRLDDKVISAIVSDYPTAEYFLCGPTGYMQFAKEALRRRGIPAERIREEAFAHAGSPPVIKPVPRPRFIRMAYALGAVTAITAGLLLTLPSLAPALVSGPFNTGHTALECESCHAQAPGTLRQQLQAKTAHLTGFRKGDAKFLHLSVGNATCNNCHTRPQDTHPTHLFMEARYQSIRNTLAPHQCAACHREHSGVRVTLANGRFCSSCHEKIELKHDPLEMPRSPSHAALTATARWDTCMGCHDYHGNHLKKTPQSLAAAIPEPALIDYFRGYGFPFGAEVRVKATNTMQEKNR